LAYTGHARILRNSSPGWARGARALGRGSDHERRGRAVVAGGREADRDPRAVCGLLQGSSRPGRRRAPGERVGGAAGPPLAVLKKAGGFSPWWRRNNHRRVCFFRPRSRCHAAGSTGADPEKRPHPPAQNPGPHRQSGPKISFSKTWRETRANHTGRLWVLLPQSGISMTANSRQVPPFSETRHS